MSRWTAMVALAFFAATVGCSSASSPSQEPAARTGTLPCDVDTVLQTVCQQCHGSPPQNDAPFPLVTYADTQTNVSGRPLWSYMLAALQNNRMPLPPATLSSDQHDALMAWLQAGAPPAESGEECAH